MQKPSEPSSNGDSKNIEQILAERGKTHGDFTENGQVMQALKDTVRTCSRWRDLNPHQREALDMILHKVGRIVCGNPNTKDHWDDIAGYARLVSDRIHD